MFLITMILHCLLNIKSFWVFSLGVRKVFQLSNYASWCCFYSYGLTRTFCHVLIVAILEYEYTELVDHLVIVNVFDNGVGYG